MPRLRLLNFEKEIEINIDEKIDRSQALIAATYRQLAVASGCLLTIYDLSPILLHEDLKSSYDVIITPHPILALTSTIDRIIYLYYHSEKLKICSIPSGAQEDLQIESFDVKNKVHLCSMDDGSIFIGYETKLFPLTNHPWSFDSKIVKLSSGKEHVLVLLSDGRVFAWGNGLHGALGLGDLEPCTQPTPIEALGNEVIDIAAGGWHSLALLADGSVMSWGWNSDGSLGLHSSDDNPEDISGVFCDPTLVTSLPLDVNCKQISAGARHSAFIGSNDQVWLCGSNKHGQFGVNSSFSIETGTSICCTSWFTFLH